MAFVFTIVFATCTNFVLGDYDYSDHEINSTPQFINTNSLPKLTYDSEKFEKCSDCESKYVVSSKSSQGFDLRQGPQIFLPRQKARISQFRAPDHYNFVPPEQQPDRSQGQVHQHPPLQFIQPEFAVIEPAVPVQPEYPHYLKQLQKQQDYQLFESHTNNNQIVPNSKHPNIIIGAAKISSNHKAIIKDENEFTSNSCSELEGSEDSAGSQVYPFHE